LKMSTIQSLEGPEQFAISQLKEQKVEQDWQLQN